MVDSPDNRAIAWLLPLPGDRVIDRNPMLCREGLRDRRDDLGSDLVV